jgi:tRNA threonylcarbamoyl adenosine modification protein YeaZ
MVLGIDTSTYALSIGLVEGDKVIFDYYVNTDRYQAERVQEIINQIMDELHINLKDISGFACSSGPGSFTGLRVGLAALKGLSVSLKRPLVGVNTLDALAYSMHFSRYKIIPMIDAKRGEIYTSIYEGNPPLQKKDYIAVNPEEFLKTLQGDCVFLGNGVRIYLQTIKRILGESAHFVKPNIDSPKGSCIAFLGSKKIEGGIDEIETIEPLYIHSPRIGRKKYE